MKDNLDFSQILQHLILFGNKFKDFSWLSWLWAGIIGLFGWILTQIGYDAKPLVGFILFLVVSDFITRITAEIVNAGGFIQAFYIKKTISSKKFGVGFFVKVLGYGFILVTAYKLDITYFLYGLNTLISNFIYGGIILYDISSNLENLRDAGFKPAGLILIRLKKEKDKYISGELQEKDNNNISTI